MTDDGDNVVEFPNRINPVDEAALTSLSNYSSPALFRYLEHARRDVATYRGMVARAQRRVEAITEELRRRGAKL